MFVKKDLRLKNTYEDLIRSPEKYLHSIDVQRGTGSLFPTTAEDYAASSFLDSRIKRSSELVYDLPLEILLRMRPWFEKNRRPHNFIFHVGHCGSTLLSRLLGELPGLFALREPLPLRTLTEFAEPGKPVSDAWSAAFSVVLGLLSRVYNPNDRAVIKPSSFCNRLIPRLLSWHEDSKAIFLFIDLETYLATMTKQTNRRETRYAITKFHRAELQHLLGDPDFSEESLSDIQCAALNWLTSMSTFMQLSDTPMHKDRVRYLLFDDFLADRSAVLEEAASFFDISYSGNDIANLATSSINSMYSKNPNRTFNTDIRHRILTAAYAEFSNEIDDAMNWAQDFAKSNATLARTFERFSHKENRCHQHARRLAG
ncbi:hypothetical protein [Nisaea sp.]|uniref:hypothetical protein n=1 Tax=Nisaea sp. TaxID=2024842 RepID=UPI0032996FC0